MCVPDWAVVEGGERLPAHFNVSESPKPNEPVRAIEVSELPNHGNPQGFLSLDEFPIEEPDQHIALARMQGVLAKLD